MGVTTCPDCGHPVSDLAPFCVHCERPRASNLAGVTTVSAASAPSEIQTETFYSSEQVTAAIPPIALQAEYPTFPVSITKFILMSLCTVGIYKLYWCYKNWQRQSVRSGENLSPFWRAFFSGIWNFVLFARLKQLCEQEGVDASWSPGWLAFAYLLFGAAWRLPEPYSLLTYLSFLPFVPVLASVQKLNLRHRSIVGESANESYSTWNVVAFVIGGLLLILIIIGSFM